MHKLVSLLVNFHKTVYHKELDKLHNTLLTAIGKYILL